MFTKDPGKLITSALKTFEDAYASLTKAMDIIETTKVDNNQTVFAAEIKLDELKESITVANKALDVQYSKAHNAAAKLAEILG